MRRPLSRVLVVSSSAGLILVAGGIAAWSWLGGREPGETPGSVASRAAASEPARLPSAARAAVQPAWARPDRSADIQTVSASQEIRTTRQPAHIEPYEHTTIYAKASGFVSKVNVDLGSRVVRGDVLAELWIPEMQQDRAQKQALVEEAQAAVGQAEAAITAGEALVAAAAAKEREAKSVVARYEAEVTLRQSEHMRFAELVRTKSLEKKLEEEKLNQLQSARSALAAAEAGVASAEASERVEQARLKQSRANHILAQSRLKVAQAELAQVEILLDYAVIRAPYDGIVTERHVHTGDFAQSAANGTADPLFTVMRETPLRIVVDIPEVDAGWVRPGLPATLSVDGIKSHQCACVVQRVAEMLDPRTHAMRVEVEVTERVEGLRPGMYGAVTISDTPPSQPIRVGAAARLGTGASN